MKPDIKEVTTNKDIRKFIQFPEKLYKDCEYFIPPLHRNERKILSGDRNPAFAFCEAKYWLAYQGNTVVGRVAGIINYKYNDFHNASYARFGWLDFINDIEVTETLLQTVENWTREKKMSIIHGPLGFTSFDASGVLIRGFKEIPTSFAHYNYPYYDELIRKAGYQKDIDWVEYQIMAPPTTPEKLIRSAELIRKRYQVHKAKFSSKKEMMHYAKPFFDLINKAYYGLYGFTELNPQQIEEISKEFLSLVTLDYSSFIMDKNNHLIGVGIAIPSLSQALKKSKGKLYPFGIIRIMKALKKNDTVDFLLIAIDPEYQNKGINAIIFEQIAESMVKNGIKYIETNRELEDNNKVQALWKDYDPRQHKAARSYIKLLS